MLRDIRDDQLGLIILGLFRCAGYTGANCQLLSHFINLDYYLSTISCRVFTNCIVLTDIDECASCELLVLMV